MDVFGIVAAVKNQPGLDPDYVSAYGFMRGHQMEAKKPFAIAIERENGYVSRFDTFICGTPGRFEADRFYIGYVTKFILYAWGGWKIYLCGDNALSEKVRGEISAGPGCQFVRGLVRKVYGKPLCFEILPLKACPSETVCSKPVGRHLEGFRIGFDAGGSDRKVSAVADGETLYSEEVEWHPKLNADPAYHFNGILEAFKAAASKMPRVDAIGVSTAGIVVDNHVMSSTLFQMLPEGIFAEKAGDIYIRAAKEIGDMPIAVQNDGDVSALAGSMSLGENRIIGIAMGTSEAAGYVDAGGNLTGWLNELALAKVDLNENAAFDATAQDIGVGGCYFSQDCAIRLAKPAGIELDGGLSPAMKLKAIQGMLGRGAAGAERIFENIGCYFAHSLALYSLFYDMRHVLLLGRVMSGRGGDIILAECKRILGEEYPDLNENISLWLPDEKIRRVGQSVAAASLPEL